MRRRWLLVLAMAACADPIPMVPDDGGDEADVCAPRAGATGGELVWARSNTELGLDGNVYLVAPRVGPDGDLALGGSTSRAGSSDDESGDGRIALLDPSGHPRWVKPHDGEAGLTDHVRDVAFDRTGNLHVLIAETIAFEPGLPEGGVNELDVRLVVLRYHPDGRRMWRWVYDYQESYSGDALRVLGADDILVVQTADGIARAVTLDSNGYERSEVELPVGGRASDVAIDPGGDILLAGWRDSSSIPFAMRARRDGTTVWSLELDSSDQHIEAIATHAEDGALISWRSSTREAGTFQVRLLAADGATAWTKDVGNAEVDDDAPVLAADCTGTIIVGGSRTKPPDPALTSTRHSVLWLTRLDPAGSVLWDTEFEFGPPHGVGGATGVAFTHEGDPVVAGGYFVGPHGNAPWLGRFNRGP